MGWKWYKHKFPSDIPWRGVGVEGVDKLRVFIFCSVIMSSSSIFLWSSQSMSPEDVFLVTTGKLHFTLTIHQMHLKSNPYNGRWLLIKKIEFYKSKEIHLVWFWRVWIGEQDVVTVQGDLSSIMFIWNVLVDVHDNLMGGWTSWSWWWYCIWYVCLAIIVMIATMIPSQSLPLPTRPSSTWPTPWIGAQFIFSSNILSFVFTPHMTQPGWFHSISIQIPAHLSLLPAAMWGSLLNSFR